ncbi:MAG: 3'(2'),5'-bisphosphate nucleotidase CysQ [Frankiaceae bacterium]|nr:3'(2'),5'-bisphosphate nucleotidase CysQ [Frankiaceae bacterium]MBV9368535.1 3'(2'),5'-bisphosphate nucleotidase CysQ [Frankiales bacterium]
MGYGDPDALRAAGDLHSHEFLVAELATYRPDDAVLSEEGVDDLSRLDADRVWIVDPLDGTAEYGETDRTDWAVHVALWERKADGLIAGAVALPARRTTLSADGGFPPLPPVGNPPRIAMSRSRPPSFIGGVAERVGAVPIQIGSAGMKAMAILLGEADAYLHRGRMKEWDSAAPAAVAQAAGLHVSRLDGSPLQFNTGERLTLDLLICQPALAESLLAAVADEV